MLINGASVAALQRLTVYLGYLKSLAENAPRFISATAIASALNMGEVQVRKDLALASGAGRPKTGYETAKLIETLGEFLGYNKLNEAVLVGTGRLGKALLEYEGFKNYGLNIAAAFDSKEARELVTATGKRIFPLSEFSHICKRMDAKIGIITVPAESSQEVCDLMVENGILAIWNFAPVRLGVPDGILVQNENMAASLAILSGHLSQKLSGKEI